MVAAYSANQSALSRLSQPPVVERRGQVPVVEREQRLDAVSSSASTSRE